MEGLIATYFFGAALVALILTLLNAYVVAIADLDPDVKPWAIMGVVALSVFLAAVWPFLGIGVIAAGLFEWRVRRKKK